MNTPKNPAGTNRSARRSATIGTAEQSTPATAARPTAVSVTGSCTSTQIPTGTYRHADRQAAAADPCGPLKRAPTTRLTRMYPAQQVAASSASPMPL